MVRDNSSSKMTISQEELDSLNDKTIVDSVMLSDSEHYKILYEQYQDSMRLFMDELGNYAKAENFNHLEFDGFYYFINMQTLINDLSDAILQNHTENVRDSATKLAAYIMAGCSKNILG